MTKYYRLPTTEQAGQGSRHLSGCGFMCKEVKESSRNTRKLPNVKVELKPISPVRVGR